MRARVLNGRLLVDQPTDLPEGTELELQVDELAAWLRTVPAAEESLSSEELQELEAIRARGQYTTNDALKEKLAARRPR